MTNKELEQAVALNHRDLFRMNAECNGGEIRQHEGIAWMYEGTGRHVMIPFPAATGEWAGDALDEMMNQLRTLNLASGGAGCWSLDPPAMANLEIQLLARGFQTGWRPNWMALDLETIQTGHPVPQGLQVQADNDISTELVPDLPYRHNEGAIAPAVFKARPERARRFIATLEGAIVGQSAVLFSPGEDGIAGLYNVGVVPAARSKGIGKAVVTAACKYATEQGYRYVILNGTGRRMYEQVGFKHISHGLTWWLMTNRYITDPPSAKQVKFAEAVATGDIAEMNHLFKSLTPADLEKPVTNGMSLIQFAIHFRRHGAAEWLVEHGAVYTVLDTWDLGWQDRTRELLQSNPLLVNQRYGDLQYTLLHIAAERNDISLARLALSFHPDLSITDKIYNGTPLGWAHHFCRTEIIRLIQEAS